MSDIVLGIKISADGRSAKAELTSISGELGKVGTQSKKAADDLKRTEDRVKGLGNAASTAARIMATFGAALSVREMYNTVAEFERLNASLKTVTGSAASAASAMTMIRSFAQETPYDVQQVTDAFIRLRSLGLDATENSLRSYGNTAAAMGRPIMQFIEAVADASTNEFERLKEFGIKASQSNDSVTFTFQGQSRTVIKSAQEIQKYLLEIGKTQFAGGMAEQMNTMNGALSNLKDSIANLVDLIGNMGISRYIRQDFQVASEIIGEFTQRLNATFGSGIQSQIDSMTAAVRNLKDEVYEIEQSQGSLWDRLFGDPDELERRRSELAGMESRLGQLMAQQSASVGEVGAQAKTAAPLIDTLTTSLQKSGQELVNATAQAFKLNDERKAVVAQIVQVAEKNGFDPGLLLAIAKTESSFDRLAKASTTSASGVFQFVKGTRDRFGVRDPFDVEQATIGAIKYLTALQDQFKNTRTAVSAYYSGEGAIQKNNNQPDAKGANYAATVAKNLGAINDALGLAGKSWDSYSDRVAAAGQAFERLKLHQDDAIKRAEDYASVQVAKIKTSLAALKAEEEAQRRVTAAEIASARTVDEKQTLIAQAARQSAAFHTSEQSLVIDEINQQQKLLEAKRAAYVNELKGAQSGQYAQDESQQLAIKQAIRAVDTDLAQLAETRRQAEIGATAAINTYAQQSNEIRASEEQSLAHLTAEYARQQGILSKLKEAAANGATAEELANLNNLLQSMPDLSMYSQANIDQATKLNQGIAETANQIKNLQTVDQKFAEEQLRLNAAFEDGVKQAQLFATHATEAFGKAGEGIGKMAVSIAQFFQQSYQAHRDLGNELKAAQEKFNKGQIDKDKLVEKQLTAQDKAATKSAQYQIGLFGDITSAAQGYFKEGTKGYQALENASKVFRAFEMAMALKSMATQLLGTETMMASDTARTGTEIINSTARGQAKAAEAVANEASGGDPYSAFPRAAAMAAMMAALGFAVAGGVMGGQAPKGYADRQKTQGTGSVLGDSQAQSTSIEDSLAKIRDNSSNDLNYSAAMLTALQNIETALAGASAQIFTDVVPSIMGAISSSGMSFKKNQWGPFEYTQKSVTDAGIMAVKQSLNTILKKGFEGLEYAEITKKFNTLFGASYKTTEYTQTMGSQTAQQFTLVIRNMVEALKAGGKAFGLSADDVTARLRKFQVDIGRVSLQGLSGDEAKKAISAVFGKLYDGMADALKLGLNKFKQVGEGSATTFFRIAEAANRTQGELAQLGITMISLKDMANKRGQADEELFKQSYLASGLASTGLAQFIDRIHGTAQELKDAVIKFTGAENLLKTAGFNTAALQGNAAGQSALIDRVGGMDSFLGLMQDFNDNFLTEAQRFAGASQQLGEQFAALGVAMPASKDAFYQMLMGIDKTTESGQKLFGALLKLNPEFAKLADKIQGIKDKYADILNPFGKYGAQISGVGKDFHTLLADLTGRNQGLLNDFVAKSGQADTQKEIATLKESRDKKFEQLKADQAEFDKLNAETDPKKRKKLIDRINALRTAIREGEDGIRALDGFIEYDTAILNSINQSIKDYQNKLIEATAGEKAGILADAATVMTDTLGDIFTEIQQTVDAARQKMEAAVTFQKALQTQIASLEGPDATAALMRSRASEATRAVDDYWANMSAGAKRNTEEELRLLGEAQQAIMDKYNAEMAAVQQLQQAVDGFNSAIASLRSQIATLQGPGAVASLASRNYGTAFQNIADYRAGIAAGGTRDYAKEVTLIQAAQTAVMDKYNSEMALIQADVQVQQQALQDGLQAQIDAINASTQAQVDAINAATEARVNAINAEVDAQTKAAQTTHDAQLKTLQEQLQAAQRLTEAYKQIAEYAKSMKLGGLSNLSPEAKLAEAQRQYQDTLAKARSGDADAASKLSGASDAYLEAARAYYGSGTQYSNIFDGVQAAMAATGGLDGGNPDSIQAHIDAMNEAFQASQDALRQAAQDQIKAVQDAASAQTKAIQQAAQYQIKALQENVAQQIKDLNDPDKNLAMKALKDAAVADLQALQKTAEEAKAGAEKAAGDAAKAAKQYQTDTLNALKAIADKAEDTRREAAQQYEAAKSDAMIAQNRAAEEARKQLESLDATAGWSSQQKAALEAIARHLDPTFTMPGQVIPSHARGGYAQAGMALVGEKGPELVRFERPAQVLTAQQTREALNGESPKTFAALEDIKKEMKASVTVLSTAFPLLIAELQELRDEVAQMKRDQKLARNA